uniref:SLL1 protein n=1 Tax=Cucumis sativus TaxID=3659 RepID=A0A0A0LQ20_CUCSA
MSLSNGVKSCAKLLKSSEPLLEKSANRGFHSTGVKRMGGHAHGHDEPYYLHAKHMYNLDRMKYQKLTMTLGVLTAFSIGVGVPIYAVVFQQKKTASG